MNSGSKDWHMGRAVRKARREKDLTQAELALRVGLSRAWISVIENGHTDVRRHAVRLAQVLDIPIDSLIWD